MNLHSETLTGGDLGERLRACGVDVQTSNIRTWAYSYDASNYRVPPVAVAFPRSVQDVLAIVRVCRETGTPLTMRGGGTSMAGNAIGPGVVMDLSRHMTRIHTIDTERKIVDVDAGVVLSVLSREAERASGRRLTFAPDPSSKSRATIGGALGNDACGNHSVRYGRTSDHVVEIDVVTSDGAELTVFRGGVRPTDPSDASAAEHARGLQESLLLLARENLASLRLELGRIPRQVSGYHLGHILPENGFDLARALVGSEGTCAAIIRARMRLVDMPPRSLLVCLGYDDVVDAARDVPTILEFGPAAVEGIDQTIVATMKARRGEDSVASLPAGRAFLYVELDDTDERRLLDAANALLSRLRERGYLIEGRRVLEAGDRASLWRVREDGAGLLSRPATGGESSAGWEDSAVAPERLAGYLTDFRGLLDRHGLVGFIYGHFGAGCVHTRINFDLRSDAGREVFRVFTRAAAELVVQHGGSLSGEHGDGRARSALLPIMYSAEMRRAFVEFRRAWDPAGIMNPGSIVDSEPFDANLALDGVAARDWRTQFQLHPVESARAGTTPWAHAVQSCIGVGRCRSDAGGVMCPSFRATGDEKDSTRGRSRVLQEMVRGARTIDDGWASEEAREALDLCLSCKACSTDCPAGVDMSSYKSEFFSHYYEGRIRPMSHYTLGWLPLWLRVTGFLAPIVNATLATGLKRVIMRLGGLSPARALPRFASRRELKRGLSSVDGGNENKDMVLFVDSFTKGFRPEVAGAAARVAQAAGHALACESDACCGLTWISTGQLGMAKRVLAKTVEKLDATGDTPIVVIEPSCAAALRKDAPELLQNPAASRVASRVRSFAEALGEWVADGWGPGGLPTAVTVQTHCHEYSVFGATVQRKVLTALGVSTIHEATGCCGVAGNFGFEASHFDMSMQVAEQALVPALAATSESTPVLTDGFSCSMQVRQLEPERRSLHIAELVDPESRLWNS